MKTQINYQIGQRVERRTIEVNRTHKLNNQVQRAVPQGATVLSVFVEMRITDEGEGFNWPKLCQEYPTKYVVINICDYFGDTIVSKDYKDELMSTENIKTKVAEVLAKHKQENLKTHGAMMPMSQVLKVTINGRPVNRKHYVN